MNCQVCANTEVHMQGNTTYTVWDEEGRTMVLCTYHLAMLAKEGEPVTIEE